MPLTRRRVLRLRYMPLLGLIRQGRSADTSTPSRVVLVYVLGERVGDGTAAHTRGPAAASHGPCACICHTCTTREPAAQRVAAQCFRNSKLGQRQPDSTRRHCQGLSASVQGSACGRCRGTRGMFARCRSHDDAGLCRARAASHRTLAHVNTPSGVGVGGPG